jgi:hypothetical protein
MLSGLTPKVLLRKRRHALAELRKQIALARPTSPGLHSCIHLALLDSSSAFSIALNALRFLGVKSAIIMPFRP